jgi:hypothetical protein
MNTKTFAQQSRNLLIDGVDKKLLYWGFDIKGNVIEMPQKVGGGYSFRGEVFDDPNVLVLWESLKKAIQNKGIEVVVEEAAYTWFNRIMALRIMAKNGYEPALLINAEGLEHTPVLLQKARQGQYSFLNKAEQDRLKKIIGDYSKDQEAFSLLLVGYCHSNKMLNSVFGKIDDYTELLLPDNMLQDSGFLHLLNTTDAISDAEYQEVELIGWLYQFYISEKKDDVFKSFKKGKKAEAKDIPAATQIFTPNWIVKYMVQNTAGKIWLDKHPNSPLKTSMKYLVENECDNESSVSSSAERIENKAIINNVEELTLIDPAAGSGHILVEGFDLLYQMYLEEYYTPEEAVESILKNNLFGLDIDDRAAQLATFAILLKAAKYYRDVFAKGWLPNVYAMPEEKNFSLQEVKDFLGADGLDFTEELEAALRLMKQSKDLGSVMKLSLSQKAQTYLADRFNELSNAEFLDLNIESIFQDLKKYIPVLLILTKKYTAVVANPPYMGRASMNAILKDYIDSNYPITKADLCTVFLEVLPHFTKYRAKFAFIIPPSWMFLATFEELRQLVLKKYSIDSLLHLSRGIFGADFGSMAAVITNNSDTNAAGTYYRLVERTFQEFKQQDLERLFLSVQENKNFKFKFGSYKKELSNIEYSDLGAKIFYPLIKQSSFSKLPGNPFGYWLSKNEVDKIYELEKNSEILEVKTGLTTGKKDKYVRIWSEVDFKKIIIGSEDQKTFINNKWFPITSGGAFRKWYGNISEIINWKGNGKDVKKEKGATIRNAPYYLKKGVSWSDVNSGAFSLRYFESGFIISDTGPMAYHENDDILFTVLAHCNTKIIDNLTKVLNPTIHFKPGNFGSLPYVLPKELNLNIVAENIEISKNNWNSQEISWEFEKSPLITGSFSLKLAYQKWKEIITLDFFQLHANEEELNRIFIDIYCLQEELTPEVALKEITILQGELNGKDLERLESLFREQGAASIALPIKKAEVISQFISYAIGLFMGRYRLDKPGLNIAHPNPTNEELANYSYNNGNVTIDDDAIIPLMGKSCNFPDDALQQINQLLDTIWGHETRTENTNFIQECLNKELEKFLIKDFYNYHCKMYKKKPIYWLFSSKTGAFQVLVYMHRMNAFTVEKIRANYMLEHLKNLRSEESMLQANASNLNTQEAKRFDQIRKDLIECEAYDMELKNVADQQITFDLDHGVTVNYAKFESVLAKIK